jgi:hypothetical protein
MDNGKMGSDMEEENSFGQTDPYMKDIGFKTKLMEMEG